MPRLVASECLPTAVARMWGPGPRSGSATIPNALCRHNIFPAAEHPRLSRGLRRLICAPCFPYTAPHTSVRGIPVEYHTYGAAKRLPTANPCIFSATMSAAAMLSSGGFDRQFSMRNFVSSRPNLSTSGSVSLSRHFSTAESQSARVPCVRRLAIVPTRLDLLPRNRRTARRGLALLFTVAGGAAAAAAWMRSSKMDFLDGMEATGESTFENRDNLLVLFFDDPSDMQNKANAIRKLKETVHKVRHQLPSDLTIGYTFRNIQPFSRPSSSPVASSSLPPSSSPPSAAPTSPETSASASPSIAGSSSVESPTSSPLSPGETPHTVPTADGETAANQHKPVDGQTIIPRPTNPHELSVMMYKGQRRSNFRITSTASASAADKSSSQAPSSYSVSPPQSLQSSPPSMSSSSITAHVSPSSSPSVSGNSESSYPFSRLFSLFSNFFSFISPGCPSSDDWAAIPSSLLVDFFTQRFAPPLSADKRKELESKQVPIPVNGEEFNQQVCLEATPSRPVMVQLYEESCFLCFLIRPLINSVAQLMHKEQIPFLFRRLDIEANDFPPSCPVARGTPTFVLYKGHIGQGEKWNEFRPKDFLNKLEKEFNLPASVTNKFPALLEDLNERFKLFGALAVWLSESRSLERTMFSPPAKDSPSPSPPSARSPSSIASSAGGGDDFGEIIQLLITQVCMRKTKHELMASQPRLHNKAFT
eukprot:GHVT01065780.1.p1 GENE.GHVT01065780.1~~GHVT01065780.1.p1  ORF type:complete len:704 (+),score=89.63 GHVT01065780.1:197-2308(+)